MTTDQRDPSPSRLSWLKVAALDQLASSARHHVTLCHVQSLEYHSLLIFRFPVLGSETESSFYCMEATCPHLGVPLENATIEGNELEDQDEIEDFVVVCPWHEYDFSLRTGKSSHGVKACVYACQIRSDRHLWIEAPPAFQPGQPSVSTGADWDLVEVRPVSEAYAQVSEREDAARTLHQQTSQLTLQGEQSDLTELLSDNGAAASKAVQVEPAAAASSSIPYPSPAPKTLVGWAVLILNTAEPAKKVAYTRFAAKAFWSGECKLVSGGRWIRDDAQPQLRKWTVSEAETPPQRPPRMKDKVRVKPGAEGKRGRGGTERSRIAILHSLANIEQWAIDLAWDIVARAPRLCAEFFGSADDGGLGTEKMPIQFFSDFVKVAEDEAKHFSLLDQRLHEMGSHFGSLPVHHGLWDSAMETSHSLTARLSIIHLVHEARGLDVNPTTIKKFDNAGDARSVDTLTTIHLDEITHVSAGHRWLSYLCSHAKPEALNPIEVFQQEVRDNFIGRLKGPFNSEDRKKAGLERAWYEDLTGEMRSARDGVVGVQRAEVPGG